MTLAQLSALSTQSAPLVSVSVEETGRPTTAQKCKETQLIGPSCNSLEVELHCINHYRQRHQLQIQKVFILSLDFTGSEEKCVRKDGESESRGC